MRWSDFDRYGHMMNANYVEIAQEARLIYAQERISRTFRSSRPSCATLSWITRIPSSRRAFPPSRLSRG
ncbi:thioesterase family protein [Corynebacterium sp. HMSC077D10]|uniref:thioesterase family protein n=1 Tax=Corynebacterium sp. HMSC077D10 TaxID=1739480 RepID=UPI003529F1DF